MASNLTQTSSKVERSSLSDALKLRSPTHTATFRVIGRLTPDDGYAGDFTWRPGNFTAEVAADTVNALYIPSSDDPTGANGVFMRNINGELNLNWYIVGDAASNDQTAGFNVALHHCAELSVGCCIPNKTIRIDGPITQIEKALTLYGLTYERMSGAGSGLAALAEKSVLVFGAAAYLQLLNNTNYVSGTTLRGFVIQHSHTTFPAIDNTNHIHIEYTHVLIRCNAIGYAGIRSAAFYEQYTQCQVDSPVQFGLKTDSAGYAITYDNCGCGGSDIVEGALVIATDNVNVRGGAYDNLNGESIVYDTALKPIRGGVISGVGFEGAGSTAIVYGSSANNKVLDAVNAECYFQTGSANVGLCVDFRNAAGCVSRDPSVSPKGGASTFAQYDAGSKQCRVDIAYTALNQTTSPFVSVDAAASFAVLNVLGTLESNTHTTLIGQPNLTIHAFSDRFGALENVDGSWNFQRNWVNDTASFAFTDIDLTGFYATVDIVSTALKGGCIAVYNNSVSVLSGNGLTTTPATANSLNVTIAAGILTVENLTGANCFIALRVRRHRYV